MWLTILPNRQRVRDKSERATVEQVLDPRTRMILFKFLNKGTITEVSVFFIWYVKNSQLFYSFQIKLLKSCVKEKVWAVSLSYKNLCSCTFHTLCNRIKDKQSKKLCFVQSNRSSFVLYCVEEHLHFSIILISFQINGCISTGKEANVYHAKDCSGEELAVKIYKTSILTFKDRDRYVSGDHR